MRLPDNVLHSRKVAFVLCTHQVTLLRCCHLDARTWKAYLDDTHDLKLVVTLSWSLPPDKSRQATKVFVTVLLLRIKVTVVKGQEGCQMQIVPHLL